MRRSVASYEAVSRTDVALWDHEQAAQFVSDAQDDIGTLVDTNADLLAALKEARDALNGAPNTVGLHCQIDAAIAKAEGRP